MKRSPAFATVVVFLLGELVLVLSETVLVLVLVLVLSETVLVLVLVLESRQAALTRETSQYLESNLVQIVAMLRKDGDEIGSGF